MSIYTRVGLPEPSRSDKVRIMQGTIQNLMRAISKHGRLPALLQSLQLERRILAGFIEGRWNEDGL